MDEAPQGQDDSVRSYDEDSSEARLPLGPLALLAVFIVIVLSVNWPHT
ncbi:hypothetical protein OKJ48_17385 [Streptomyces kunmingensis]|uniref:Uncharacterized protein n=1 Tax=Streptomyces kunmingensis TaxID=68225 RepID=A0ABU6CBC7_9ACTN|nr:hypothetical protein [Streptomyces kunmingensis]MEB3962006.1 hypothetical protein [Streptomyces kunmingensis]